MTVIITIACAFCAYVLIKNIGAAKAEAKRQEAEDERQAEAKRIREEWKQQQAEAREWTRKQVAIEREQMRLAKEQEKQAEQLAKHEKRISDLEYRMEQAEADISHWNETVSALYALLDIEMTEQAGALPGSKTDIKCQKKIIALNNQIHAAEARLNKAKHVKETSARELKEA